MAKSNLEIFNIHRTISGNALDRIIRPHFADQRYIKKFVEQGYIKNSSGSVIFGIEMNIGAQIKQLSQEYNLRLNDKEIQAWSDLYSILLTPHDEHIRDECLRVISIYECHFEALYLFFMHWVKIQYRLLCRNRENAIEMINSKLDMFSLTCSTPIPENIRKLLTDFAMTRAEKLNNETDQVVVEPCNILYHIEKFRHPDSLDDVLPCVFVNSFAEKHLKPVVKSPDGENTPSFPLLVCLLNHDHKKDVLKPIDQFDFSEVHIPINRYRIASSISIPSLLRLLMKKCDSMDEFSKKGQLFPYCTYLGFFSDFSLLSMYAYNFSYTANGKQPVFKYEPYFIAPMDRPQNTDMLLADCAYNIYESLMMSIRDTKTKNGLIYRFMTEEDIENIALPSIRTLVRVLGRNDHAEHIYRQAMESFLVNHSVESPFV